MIWRFIGYLQIEALHWKREGGVIRLGMNLKGSYFCPSVILRALLCFCRGVRSPLISTLLVPPSQISSRYLSDDICLQDFSLRPLVHNSMHTVL